MPDTRQILNWLGLLLLIAIVVPFVIYAIPGAVGAEGSYVVLSGSMEPSISTGDVVIVDGVEPADIEERDVITYRRNDADTPTTHRVVGINEEGGELSFVTQGDANDQPDASPVPAPQVMGQVVFAIPYIGYVIEFVNTPTGFIALVVAPFALLLLSEVYAILSSGGSGSKDEERGGTTQEFDRSDAARAASAPPVGAFKRTAFTEADPVDGETESASRRSFRAPALVDRNGREAAYGPTEDEGGSDDENAITLTRADLRLSLGVLSGTAVYAGWVVYNIQVAWSFAVAFGSGIGLFLVGSMYYAAGNDDDGTGSASNSGDAAGATAEVRTDGAAVPSPEDDSGSPSGNQAESRDRDA